MPKRKAGLLEKIILLFFLLLITAEITCRVYNKFNPTFVFPGKSYNRFRVKPFTEDFGGFYLNSRGFKDVEFSKNKKIGVFRILGIGDSFVFGIVPYQHNFLTLLEDKINRSGKPSEIINMGVPCLGPDGYFALLMNEGLDLNPDLVICFFFIGNDFTDNLQDNEIFYTGYFIKYILKIAPRYSEGLARETVKHNYKYVDDKPSFSLGDFMRVERARSDIFIKSGPWQSIKFNNGLSYLIKMKDICDYKHIKFLVVLIPDQLQVDATLQSDFFTYFKGMRQADIDFSLPNRWLHLRLKELHIDYFDLSDDFLKQAKNRDLYKPNDTHWNVAGNELAADLILDKLKREDYFQ